MLNRVFLLISGFAFGWTAVKCLTVPEDKLRSQWAGLALSLAVGALVIVALGVTSPAAGGAALGAFLVSALVAYAGNARQIDKLAAPPPERRKLERPVAKDTRRAVLLVCEGQPREYGGPAAWASLLRRMEAEGRPTPHWFVRPWVYARIRAAYRAMGGRHPLHAAMDGLAQALQARLGADYACQAAYLSAEPRLLDALARLAEQGLGAMVLVPVGFAEDPHPRLRAQIVQSRILEIGVRVSYAPSFDVGWENLDSRWLEHTLKGTASPPQPLTSETVETLYQRVMAAANA